MREREGVRVVGGGREDITSIYGDPLKITVISGHSVQLNFTTCICIIYLKGNTMLHKVGKR